MDTVIIQTWNILLDQLDGERTLNGLGTKGFVWETNAERFERNGSRREWNGFYRERYTLTLGTNASHRERNIFFQDGDEQFGVDFKSLHFGHFRYFYKYIDIAGKKDITCHNISFN